MTVVAGGPVLTDIVPSVDDRVGVVTHPPLRQHLDSWLIDNAAGIIAARRHIHAHPELSMREQRTAQFVAAKLAAAGLSPRLLPDGNGVICDIGPAGPTVALRADLDALPLSDTKDVPYRSTVQGVCHACGHDVHTTIVLAAGLALAALVRAGGRLPGRVRLLFQPSEESFPAGSLTMIENGCLDGVDSIFAVHCDPRLATGLVGLRPGPLTAAADRLDVRLSGPGGHTARPHNTVDIVNALGRIVTEVPALLDRRVDPRVGLALVFGSIHAGVAPNAIPREGTVSGTVRVLDRDAWQRAPGLIDELVRAVAAPTGAKAEVTYIRGVPPVINDPGATTVFRAAGAAALGLAQIVDTPTSMGGEDFSWYLEQVPGAMARLGVGRPGEELDLHQPDFDVDERSIAVGVRLLTHTAVDALAAFG